jgi:hypothetical protein
MTDVLVLTREPDKKEHGRGELSRRGEGNLPALIERAGPGGLCGRRVPSWEDSKPAHAKSV